MDIDGERKSYGEEEEAGEGIREMEDKDLPNGVRRGEKFEKDRMGYDEFHIHFLQGNGSVNALTRFAGGLGSRVASEAFHSHGVCRCDHNMHYVGQDKRFFMAYAQAAEDYQTASS